MSHPILTDGANKALDHLRHELATIRTGRANPAVIEELAVACYGGVSPLQQLAAISAPEPRLLVVQPWDAALVKDIEKALSQSNLGITPVVDGKVIRLPIPAMTEDRRSELIKTVNVKAEEARVRIRNAREEAMKQLKHDEKSGVQSADAVATAMKGVQQAVAGANVTIGELVTAKTIEISTI